MKRIISFAFVCKCLLKLTVSCSFCCHFWQISEGKFAILCFASASPHLILHNRAWRGLLCMNMKRNLTPLQNNSLCCHAWATLHCSTKCGPWFRKGTENRDVKFSVAFQATQAHDWPGPATVTESHIFPPQSLSSNRRTDCTADREWLRRKRRRGKLVGERSH